MKQITAHPFDFVLAYVAVREKKVKAIDALRTQRRLMQAIEEKTGPIELVASPYNKNVTALAMLVNMVNTMGQNSKTPEKAIEAFNSGLALLDSDSEFLAAPAEDVDKRIVVKLVPDDLKALQERLTSYLTDPGVSGPESEAYVNIWDACAAAEDVPKPDESPAE